jgi:UDP-3-O-[3-hydroxymyristoyl] N-acetylglucosamine deacetylase/3-hydroxyacyl-[acyl-carrier-protein] dehydratase
MNFQRTIAEKTKCAGIGLHTGNKTKVFFNPAPINTGIKFIRTDLPENPAVEVNVSSYVEAPLRTTIGIKEGVYVHTIEHVMAALSGLQIDNIIIELEGEEFPEIDGSSLPFVKLLQEAGLKDSKEPKKHIELKKPICIRENDAYLIAFPSKDFNVSFTLEYKHSFIKSQYASFKITEKNFIENIAPARTFCLESDVQELLKRGLGKGGSLENTVLVGDKGVVNGKLRFDNEFVRHKISDLIGDLYLLGRPLKAGIIAAKSGHKLNIKLAEEIAAMFSVDTNGLLDINLIKKALPHRYPFLLVDKIVSIDEDKKIVGIKNVTVNEQFFVGHFPERPVMPGVLIVEALAQTAGVLMLRKGKNLGKLPFLMGVDKLRLRKPVVPGDQLEMVIEVLKIRRDTGKVLGKAYVENHLVAEAEIIFALVDEKPEDR